MQEWYIKQMTAAHNEKRFDDRRNYAQLAKIDFVRYFYMMEGN